MGARRHWHRKTNPGASPPRVLGCVSSHDLLLPAGLQVLWSHPLPSSTAPSSLCHPSESHSRIVVTASSPGPPGCLSPIQSIDLCLYSYKSLLGFPLGQASTPSQGRASFSQGHVSPSLLTHPTLPCTHLILSELTLGTGPCPFLGCPAFLLCNLTKSSSFFKHQLKCHLFLSRVPQLFQAA